MTILIILKNMNKKFKFIVLIALFCLSPVAIAWAADTQTGSVYVAKDEIMSGNLYVMGDSITVDGTISGDLIAAAQSIKVSGRIEGDIIAIAQEVSISGDVGGNIRVIANTIDINGSVARNVNAFGSKVVLGTNSKIGWDLYLMATRLESRGIIGGSLNGWSRQASLAGQIGKNVTLTLDPKNEQTSLVVAPTAIINGNLNYSSNQPAVVSDQASIIGEITQNKTILEKKSNDTRLWIWKELFAIFSALSVGLVLIYLFKKPVTEIIEKTEAEPFKVLIPGLFMLFALPPIALILAITIIGVPLSLIILSSWVVMIYIAKIISAILVGKIISSKVISLTTGNYLLWPLIIGVIIIWLLAAIPYLGWIISLIAAWFGLGGIWNYAYRER